MKLVGVKMVSVCLGTCERTFSCFNRGKKIELLFALNKSLTPTEASKVKKEAFLQNQRLLENLWKSCFLM